MDDPPSSESEVGSPVVLPRLRSDTTFSDCILEVDGEEIRAHRAVLASVSPFFEAAFCGRFKEAREKKVTLKETTANAVHRLLDFVYGVEMESCIRDAVLALDAWELARRFEIKGLQNLCAGLAAKHMNVCNAIDVFRKSVQFGCCEDILSKSFLYIVHNFEDIVRKDTSVSKYHELSYSDFIDVLTSSELVCSESTRINAIKNWIDPGTGDPDDHDVRRIYAEALMSEIRFELLEDHELAIIFCENAEWIPRNILVYALTNRPNRGSYYSKTITRSSCENCGSLNMRMKRNRSRHTIVTLILPLPASSSICGNKFSMMSKKLYFKIHHWVFSVRAHASDDETIWFHIICERMLSIPKHYKDQMGDLLEYRFHIVAEITSFKRPLWTSEALFSPVGMCICTNAPISALTVACSAQITITAHKKYEMEI